jgi:hypothetical protein
MKSYLQSEYEFSKNPRVQIGTAILVCGLLGLTASLRLAEDPLLPRAIFLLIQFAGAAIIIRERLRLNPKAGRYLLLTLALVLIIFIYFFVFAG